MAKWIRTLTRPAAASDQWHVLGIDKEFAVANALCGEKFPGPVEAATDEERTARDGRCPACETQLAAKEEEALAAVHHRSA